MCAHLAEVDEGGSETESRVDATSRVTRETFLTGVLGGHLPEGDEDTIAWGSVSLGDQRFQDMHSQHAPMTQ